MEISGNDIGRMKAYLEGINDPRRQWGNIRHKLVDILIITVQGGHLEQPGLPAARFSAVCFLDELLR